MVGGLLLASYYFFGGSIGNVLSQWEQLGFFSYILPFLLIFSVVYGVLMKIKIFEDNKAINAIIALTVGFMSLQWGLVSQFFSELFPRVGVGVAFLLVAIIFLGMFLPTTNWAIYLFFGVSALIVVSVLLNSSAAMGWWMGDLFNWDWYGLLPYIVLIGAIAVAILSSKDKDKPAFEKIASPFFRDMHK